MLGCRYQPSLGEAEPTLVGTALPAGSLVESPKRVVQTGGLGT